MKYSPSPLIDPFHFNFHSQPKECRVMRENKPSAGQPLGASKGFGFLSFKSHETALLCLRKLNNNPNVFGKNNVSECIDPFVM